ncbi:MAG: ATP-binding cassette domain-containing protein [Bacteroidetes bacterium]|nr:ATP-binding cassette domain-containing protein [Bacteroidota bacterium]
MGIVIQTTIIGAPLSSIFISLIFFYRALSSLSVVQTKWNEFLSMSGSLANMRSFQAELDANQELKGELAFFEFKNSIEFRNAGFNYDTELILKEISLTINKNETVAFVGSSGSGKTTLVNLISGLMPVDSGEFLIDNKSAKNINMDTFHKRIGYITQEPIIFDATIFDNVTLWASPNAENKIRFRNAIEQSSIEIFINELPLGEDTELGNNGINLSGGQKQRISIAREIYKDIDILIMDEATSALDSETERNIQANIDKLRGKYTIIIVAHRLSTIKNADKIMVMKHGEIVSTGSYEELIEKEHSFRKMVDLQELG